MIYSKSSPSSCPRLRRLTAVFQGSFSAALGLLLMGSAAVLAVASPAVAKAGASSQTPLSTAETVPTLQAQRTEDDIRFGCEFNNGEYQVMYYPESQPGRAYAWAKPAAMGGGWTPERRCNEISRRLEFYRPDGLQELQTSTENGYNIVCATTERDPACRIVLTVPQGQDPFVVRDRVFENLTVADGGQQTNAVNTFSGSDAGNLIQQIGEALNIDLPRLSSRRARARSIDLRPFLDRNDGGTGTRLRS